MALFASFTGVPCPICRGMIVASGIYFDKSEPELGVTKCEYCETELQVSKDPLTGETRVERVKRN
jgi:formate dehydrogenase maturation protein FdhE